nr:UDP-glycosyltransferase 86A2-like [Ipomoea batatas]
MGDSGQKPHAILICYPLQGHVIPSVHLACRLAEKGFTVTFINTHSVHYLLTNSNGRNVDIFSGIRKPGLDIRYVTISDGLPPEWDRGVNHDQFMASLLHVYSAHVEEALKKILTSSEDSGGPPVNCLIADTFFVFPGKLAKKYKLLFVSFWTEPALVFTLYYHLHLLRLNGHFGCIDMREDDIEYVPGVKSIQAKDLMSYIQETETETVCHQIIFNSFRDARNADFVLCNSVQELEQETVAALQEKTPFFAVGPIFPPVFAQSAVATSLWSESDCTQWLDKKPHGSVLYVTFGSYAHLSKQVLLEIAHGLSLSKVNFLWALRPDMVSSDESDPLPGDLRAEVSDRAMIIPWCSQKQVLAHPAIGGFLSHCGWNSTMESMWCEVPMLCFPLLTDQFTNRKLIVDDWKVGLNLCDRKPISKLEISDKIKLLMGGKTSDELRNAVKQVKKTMEAALSPNGSSQKNMDKFIKDVYTAIQQK